MSLDSHNTAAQSQACPRLHVTLFAAFPHPLASAEKHQALPSSGPARRFIKQQEERHHQGAIVGVQRGKATPSDHTTSTSTHSWEAGISARLSRLSLARARQSWERLLAQSPEEKGVASAGHSQRAGWFWMPPPAPSMQEGDPRERVWQLSLVQGDEGP